MLRTYEGRCHCGAVRFEADLDIAAGTVKCNCTMCARMRLWSARATEATFRLLAGQEALVDYRGANPVAHHPFCRVCGIRCFQRVETPNWLGKTYYNVSIACLDGVDVDELVAAPVLYFDGLTGNFAEPPQETRHL